MKFKELYDSDHFTVVNIDIERKQFMPIEHGFLIVDKTTNMEVFLHGASARIFEKKIKDWQQDTPFESQVEEALDGFTQLAAVPLLMH